MSERPIFELYDLLNLWKNPICMKCRNGAKSELFGPISIWQLGREFMNDPYKLVFIGKNARGEVVPNLEGQRQMYGFAKVTNEADEWIAKEKKWIWPYLSSIIENIFGSGADGWEKVAFTNLVKCNNSDKTDNTTSETKNYCLSELGVTWRELDILKPKNVVIFSHYYYDHWIENFSKKFIVTDVTTKDFSVAVGQKKILWWDRHCVDRDGRTFRILRTSHPERINKIEFVARIADWVKDSIPTK